MRIEPATLDDLEELVELVMALFDMEEDFQPDRHAQEKGLRLILERPNRGRIFVLRSDDRIFGMVNLLFTISTARGGPIWKPKATPARGSISKRRGGTPA